jgi:demethylmenaquinone methyltransferase/2-methoxy-6-polyprenyl-1,4-benzoquinol methylase
VTKPPIRQTPGRKEQVRNMFNSIAVRYDLLNHLLSFGIDRTWRKKLIRLMAKENPRHVLDLATGTADLAIAALEVHPETITGTDISESMLEIGRQKVIKLGVESKVTLLVADSENLPFKDESFDAATVAFGVRNYENLSKGLAEMNRVLRPGGKAYILEFAKPVKFPVKQVFTFYFKIILPVIGRIISKHSSAYSYLPESVEVVPQGKEFLQLMTVNGFRDVKAIPMTFGISLIYVGTK